MMSDLRERIARAIHDGPNAQAQYEMSGIRPHTAEECEWFDQYLADADAVLAVLRDEPAEAKLAEIRATVENPHIPREQLRPRLLATLDGEADESH